MCCVREKFFLILSLFGLLPSANHKIYDFFIFSLPAIAPNDSFLPLLGKINSFYCHKQFKFLIFTQKYLRSIDVTASKVEIYYRMVQLDVKSSCAVEIPTGFSVLFLWEPHSTCIRSHSWRERVPNLHFKLSLLDVISVHKFQIFSYRTGPTHLSPC